MKLYYRLYLPGPQHFFRTSNRAMATGWSFTRTLFPPLTRHPVYSATVCCAVFSPPSSHLILVQSSSAHPARTPVFLVFLFLIVQPYALYGPALLLFLSLPSLCAFFFLRAPDCCAEKSLSKPTSVRTCKMQNSPWKARI